MDLLPTAVGTRPRLACELRPEGLVLARAEGSAGALTGVTRVPLPAGALLPSLRPGNVQEPSAVAGVLRRALETVAVRGQDRSRYMTLIVPDSCVRVLLLDFDSLPSRAAEALPLVRFRLKKLLPFDVDHALVSFQIMSTERTVLRVLAVAIPLDVLAEYEAIVTGAGMLPGAVLPSTLATLAALDPTPSGGQATALVLNSASGSLTSAIVRAGVLLLHRTVDLNPAPVPALEAVGSSSLHSRPDEPGTSSAFATEADAAVALLNLAPEVDNPSRDLAETVSVASAYFEDTLGTPPESLLSAGIISAQAVRAVLQSHGLDTVAVRELVDTSMFSPLAGSNGVRDVPPPGWLAGLRGALRS